MKRIRIPRGLVFAMGIGVALAAAGCDGTTGQITFLDFLNTVFLAITAAGGYVIIQNA